MNLSPTTIVVINDIDDHSVRARAIASLMPDETMLDDGEVIKKDHRAFGLQKDPQRKNVERALNGQAYVRHKNGTLERLLTKKEIRAFEKLENAKARRKLLGIPEPEAADATA